VAKHPVVGAGIGQDILVMNDERGIDTWRRVHNAYLQYGVDLGLPGLLMFVWLHLTCYRTARAVEQRAAAVPSLRDLQPLATGVKMSLVAFGVAAMFHPIAYQFYFFSVAGLAVALSGCAVMVLRDAAGSDPRAHGDMTGDLLALTGGLGPTGAIGDARLTRVGADGRKETTSLDLRTADVPLQGGDVLYVPPLTVIQDVVEVRGAFNGSDGSKTSTAGKPTVVQRLELARGERIRDVVIKAGGAAPFADLRLAYVDRADAGPAQRIPVDLHRLLIDKDETENILVHNGDVVVLPVVEDKVYVVGEVKSPGAQDFRPDLTAREYLAAAGGPGACGAAAGRCCSAWVHQPMRPDSARHCRFPSATSVEEVSESSRPTGREGVTT